MAITGDDQFEWRSFKIGDGTVYDVVRFDLSDVQVRRNPFERIGATGTILPRTDLLGGRTIVFEVEIQGTSRADLQTKMDALDAASVPSLTGDDTLSFQLLGSTRRIYCRPKPARWAWTVAPDIGLLVTSVDLEFYAQDARIYTNTGTVTVLA